MRDVGVAGGRGGAMVKSWCTFCSADMVPILNVPLLHFQSELDSSVVWLAIDVCV